MTAITPEALRAARDRLAPLVHRTPVLTSQRLDDAIGARLYFKCENFQKVGAFKARGAANAVMSLAPTAAARGVATHSSGNHGQALAWAAAGRGIAATVVMPENSAAPKIAAVRGYGARVVFCQANDAARRETLDRVVADTGAEFIAPFDDLRVIAGQASCAAELIEDTPPLDTLITPVGGGGLISGTALAIQAYAPTISLLGAEPAAADDAARSLASDRREINPGAPATIADGLKTSIGELTWPIIAAHVDDIVTVSEPAIIDAMREIWQTLKIVIEPSCAVSLAAIRERAADLRGQAIGVVLTGGNVDLDRLPW